MHNGGDADESLNDNFTVLTRSRALLRTSRTGGPYYVGFALNQTNFRRKRAVVKRGHFGRFMKKYVQTF